MPSRARVCEYKYCSKRLTPSQITNGNRFCCISHASRAQFDLPPEGREGLAPGDRWEKVAPKMAERPQPAVRDRMIREMYAEEIQRGISIPTGRTRCA